MLGGYYKNSASWKNTPQKTINWSMKANENYTVYISVDTKKGHRYIYYTPASSNKGSNGKYVHYGLGGSSRDKNWHTYTRNLEADLKRYESDNSIMAAEGFLIRDDGARCR